MSSSWVAETAIHVDIFDQEERLELQQEHEGII